MKETFECEIGLQLSNYFAYWAFGEGFENMRSEDLRKAWNYRHGESVFIEENEIIEISAKKMVAHWIKETDGK